MKKTPKKSTSTILPIKPVQQQDGYSCGLRAMQAFYWYFFGQKKGISDDMKAKLNASLIERLGVEHSLPYFPGRKTVESMFRLNGGGGTWPHDLMSVLHQDGFEMGTFTDFDELLPSMRESLGMGLPSFILRNNFIHWVLISGIEKNSLWITDSMYEKPYRESFGEFSENMNCAILVTGYSECTRKGEYKYSEATALCLEMAGKTLGI